MNFFKKKFGCLAEFQRKKNEKKFFPFGFSMNPKKILPINFFYIQANFIFSFRKLFHTFTLFKSHNSRDLYSKYSYYYQVL